MIEIHRTNSDNGDFIELVKALDAYLAEMDGEDHAFYAQLNKTSTIRYVVLAYEHGKPVGCGAIRESEPGTMEIKRMYVVPECRGKGIAARMLGELERWAAELSYTRCILETGNRQHEAIGLYEKMGYLRIPNYGKYKGMEHSVCFEKEIAGHV